MSTLNDLMGITMSKIREMVDVNTIIGDAITTPDGTTIIPVSKVNFGFASGGADYDSKNADKSSNFGGGSGAGVSITPIAFLVVSDGNVKVLHIGEAPSTTADRIVELVPEVIDKIKDLVSRDKEDDFVN